MTKKHKGLPVNPYTASEGAKGTGQYHNSALWTPDVILAAPDLLEALKAMQSAAEEIAVEFIEHKRAANWGIINAAYVACERAIAKAEGKV
jgi:hypothetical protein